MVESKYFNKSIMYEIIMLIAMILYLTNFLGNYGYYIIVIFSPFSLFFFFTRNITWKFLIVSLILILFNTLYSIIGSIYGYIELGMLPAYLILPTLALFIGYFIGEKDYNYNKTYIIIYVLLISITVFFLLSYLKTITHYGNLQVATNTLGGRMIESLWGGNREIKATEMTLKLSLGLPLLPTIFIKDIKKSKRWIIFTKVITVICFSISVFLSLQMGSRTAIIIVICSFIIFYLFIKPFSIKKIFNACFMLVTCWFLYNIDLFNIRTWLNHTSAFNRLKESGLENSRIDVWKEVISKFFTYPLGGRNISLNKEYAHNLWLDVAYDSGWIATIILIIFTVISILVFIKFISLRHPLYLKAIILLLFTSLLLFFITEPVLSGGEKDYFVLFCLFIGIAMGLNKHATLRN